MNNEQREKLIADIITALEHNAYDPCEDCAVGDECPGCLYEGYRFGERVRFNWEHAGLQPADDWLEFAFGYNGAALRPKDYGFTANWFKEIGQGNRDEINDAMDDIAEAFECPDEISITWNVDDVINRAEKNEIFLNKYQARRVLKLVEDNLDANCGVSWGTLDYFIEDVR